MFEVFWFFCQMYRKAKSRFIRLIWWIKQSRHRTVWVLVKRNTSQIVICGVFSTRKKAEKAEKYILKKTADKATYCVVGRFHLDNLNLVKLAEHCLWRF
jgi:hypothetical protein